MQLHELQPKHKNRDRKRIGRGGKRGSYSGRGVKGQKSRAGRRIKPAIREMLSRMPKLRGIKFKSLKPKAKLINLGDLEKNLKGDIINRKTLLESGLINETDKRVKILANGEIKRSLKVEEIEISKGAKNKIEKAGGTNKKNE